MKPLLALCLTVFLSSTCLAQSYTLMTTEPAKTAAKGETSTEGFFIEIVNLIFKRAGLSLQTKVQPWIRSQEAVTSAVPEQGLVITPLTRTPERENQYDWILPIESYYLQFITNDKAIDLADLNALKKRPVCAWRESPAEAKLISLGFEQIHARVFEQKCFQDLRTHKEQVMLVHGPLAAAKGYKLVGGNPDELILGASFEQETLYLASTKKAVSEADQQKLKAALEALRADGTYQTLISKYYE